MRIIALWIVILALLVLSAVQNAQAESTVGCSAKSTWRQSIVERIVEDWYSNESHATDFLDLISAEQGIAACQLGERRLTQLHTSTLPRSLQPDELGGVLLANEMSWAHLLPEPEGGLSGHTFRVIEPPLSGNR